MIDARNAIRLVLLRELDAFCREVEAFPDDTLLWATPAGVTNSCGTLALHVAGNLQHYVGARLGGTGYVRHREAEFSARGATRSELVAELQRARAVVDDVLRRWPAADWDQPFPEVVGGVQVSTGVFLVQVATHLAMHLGQAGYLRRMLTGTAVSVGPVSMAALGALLDEDAAQS